LDLKLELVFVHVHGQSSVIDFTSPTKIFEWIFYLLVCYIAIAPGKILRTLLIGRFLNLNPLQLYSDFVLISTLIIAIFLPLLIPNISPQTVSWIGIFNAYSTIFGIKAGSDVAIELFPTSLFMLFYCTFVSGVGGLILRTVVLHLLHLPVNLSEIFPSALLKVLVITFVWCYSAHCSLPLSRADIEWLLFIFCVTYDIYKLQQKRKLTQKLSNTNNTTTQGNKTKKDNKKD
jgi:hypothetical protein